MHELFVHTSPLAQVPQASVPPQPSEIVPQSLPAASQVVFEHMLHVCATASQACPAPQAAQVIGLPQPSTTFPHLPVQSPGTQAEHWCVSPSQTWPCGHVPHVVRFPHLSGSIPQAAPAVAQAFVTHLLEVGSQVDIIFGSHVPHSSVPAQVESGPQVAPSARQVVCLHPLPGPVPAPSVRELEFPAVGQHGTGGGGRVEAQVRVLLARPR